MFERGKSGCQPNRLAGRLQLPTMPELPSRNKCTPTVFVLPPLALLEIKCTFSNSIQTHQDNLKLNMFDIDSYETENSSNSPTAT